MVKNVPTKLKQTQRLFFLVGSLCFFAFNTGGVVVGAYLLAHAIGGDVDEATVVLFAFLGAASQTLLLVLCGYFRGLALDLPSTSKGTVNFTPATKAKDQVKGGFFLDVVVRKGSAIFQLFPSEDQSLLIRGDTFLVLDLLLHVLDGVTWLDIKSDGLARKGFHENLHVVMNVCVFVDFDAIQQCVAVVSASSRRLVNIVRQEQSPRKRQVVRSYVLVRDVVVRCACCCRAWIQWRRCARSTSLYLPVDVAIEGTYHWIR